MRKVFIVSGVMLTILLVLFLFGVFDFGNGVGSASWRATAIMPPGNMIMPSKRTKRASTGNLKTRSWVIIQARCRTF